jgi:hypothetical protein
VVVRGGIRPRLMEHRRCQDAAGPSFHRALLRALRPDPFGVLLGGVAAGASVASLRCTKGSNPAAPSRTTAAIHPRALVDAAERYKWRNYFAGDYLQW